MIARHLAYSYFKNPEKKPVEIAKIITTKGKEVPIFSEPGLPVTPAQENEYLETVQKILGDKDKIRKVGPESDYYNCHGLTFAQRRGHVIDEDTKILLEDYELVVKSNDPFLLSKLQQIPLEDAIPPIVAYPNGEHSAPISRIENDKIYCIGTDGPYGEYELEINDFSTIYYGDKDRSWRIYKWPDQQRVPLVIPTGEQTDLQSSQQTSDILYPNKGKDRA